MTESLIEKYKLYYSTDENYAISFVKKNLADAENKWIKILHFKVGDGNDIKKLEFENVVCEIFLKKILPVQPPKEYFSDPEDYILNCEAITWETAQRDIAEQKKRRIQGHKYSMIGRKVKIANKKFDGTDAEPKYLEEYKVVYVRRLNPDKPLKKLKFKIAE